MRLRLVLLGVVPAVLACPGPTPRPDGGTGQPPTITSISPTTGPTTGGTTVTVNGSRFADGATVKFGDAAGQQVVVSNALRLTVRTPAVMSAGRVTVTVTNPDGTSGTLADAFTYESVAARAITEALFVTPGGAETIDRTGGAMISATISAQVEVPMVTRGMGQGTGVRAQVGFARMVSSPPADADFTWVDAMYSADADGAAAGDQARDVYQGVVSVPGATTQDVTYRLAARFSVDNGMTWKIADRDGSANGTSEAQLHRLVVQRKGIDWCRMGGQTVGTIPPMVSLRGTQPGPVFFAQVFAMGRTEPAGAGRGVKGQIGYGPAGAAPSTWTWVDGTYNVDVGNNDEWQAMLPNPGEGTYKFAFRFNLDDGAWAYCDNDGLAMNDFTEDQAGTLVVGPAGVDRCNLQFPNSAQALVNTPGPLAYGRVFAGGITDRLDGGVSPTLTVELGIGPGGVRPDQASWQWSPTTFNVPVLGGGAEFQANLPASPRGTYAFAFRARVGTTGAFTYCDLDGSENDFQTNQAGVYTVEPFSFADCTLRFPPTLGSVEGRPTELVYGRVFAPGVTVVTADGGAPPSLEAELGVGPDSSDPAAVDAGWQWTAGAFNVPVPGGLEYQARLTGPSQGTYDYAWRVRYLGGPWAYCDLNGLAVNGYEPSQAGALTARALDVDECFVDTAANAALPGATTAPYLARVRVPTLTGAMGQGLGVTAELGSGPVGSQPSTWTTWSPAAFDADAMEFDRYTGTLTAPNTTGALDVAFRFRVGTRPFVYCDRDGQANGYQAANASRLTVSNATISACQLLTPSAFNLPSGSALSASVSVEGTGTLNVGQAPNIRAQIGMGAQDNASTSLFWGWRDAAYLSDATTRDVYGVTFQPSYTGPRAVSARVSVDNGQSWTYCDLNGSDQNGYEESQQYNVNVTSNVSLDFCRLQFPTSLSIDAGTTRVYGQVFHQGLTPDAGAPLRAEFGIGSRNAEPGLTWQWSASTFGTLVGNNNEYFTDYRPDGGNPHYAFRFSRDDGGTWCYADLDGHGANGITPTVQPWAGFSGNVGAATNIGLVTP